MGRWDGDCRSGSGRGSDRTDGFRPRRTRSRAAHVTLGPIARKTLLTVHIAVSVGWMGAAAAYVALNLPSLTGAEEQAVRAAHLMMPVVAVYALMPLAMATLLTGVALSLGTKRGLLQHYWVAVSLVVTCSAQPCWPSICRRWKTSRSSPQTHTETSRLCGVMSSIPSVG